MTAQKDLKRFIRARQQKTGESYTTARMHVVRERADKLASKALDPRSSHHAQVQMRGNGAREPYEFHKIWIQQSAAALQIRDRFGLQNSLQYLVGEKLITFIHASESHPEFAAELPRFVSWIRRNFAPGELISYLGTIRRTGILPRLTPDGEVQLRRRGRKSTAPYNPIDRDLKGLQRACALLLGHSNVILN